MPDSDLLEKLADILLKKEMTLVTAESCTGGLLSSAITRRPGVSKIFERGFVTYSNESKTELLGVTEDMIERHGAVSRETAEAMAKGALKNSRADIAVSVTGIAGPDGGSEDKPVGLVYFGSAMKDSISSAEHHFSGDRFEIQKASVTAALELLIETLGKNGE